MSDQLVDQPTSAPTRKVLFGAVTGVLVWVLTAAAGRYFGAEIPEELAMAIPVVAAYVVSYAVRDVEVE